MGTRRVHSIKDKRILITAGPTWVAIDRARVISNTASGETGILLARELTKAGAKVTLLLGPVGSCCLDKRIRLKRFKFFDELKNSLIKELESGRYDIVIHSAAVSDYKPEAPCRNKIKSGINKLKLTLVPAPKIINLVKKAAPAVSLIGFKFEPGLAKNSLLEEARSLIKRADLGLAVANTLDHKGYKAYIVSKDKACGPFRDKAILVKQLIRAIDLLTTD